MEKVESSQLGRANPLKLEGHTGLIDSQLLEIIPAERSAPTVNILQDLYQTEDVFASLCSKQIGVDRGILNLVKRFEGVLLRLCLCAVQVTKVTESIKGVKNPINYSISPQFENMFLRYCNAEQRTRVLGAKEVEEVAVQVKPEVLKKKPVISHSLGNIKGALRKKAKPKKLQIESMKEVVEEADSLMEVPIDVSSTLDFLRKYLSLQSFQIFRTIFINVNFLHQSVSFSAR